MRMMVVEAPSAAAPPCSTFTVCCDEDLRFPASIARWRSCCTAKSSESRWVRYAVAMSRAPSCGRVDASSTCPSSGSGNSAIGDAIDSSCSGAIPPWADAGAPPAAAGAAAAAWGATGAGATGFAPGCCTAMGAGCGGGAGGGLASSFEEPAQAQTIATTRSSRRGVMPALCQGTPRRGVPKAWDQGATPRSRLPGAGHPGRGRLVLHAGVIGVGPLLLQLPAGAPQRGAGAEAPDALVGDLLACAIQPSVPVRVGDHLQDLVGGDVGQRPGRLAELIAAEEVTRVALGRAGHVRQVGHANSLPVGALATVVPGAEVRLLREAVGEHQVHGVGVRHLPGVVEDLADLGDDLLGGRRVRGRGRGLEDVPEELRLRLATPDVLVGDGEVAGAVQPGEERVHPR